MPELPIPIPGSPVRGKTIPLCLPNNVKWDSQECDYIKIESETRKELRINEEALEILKHIKGKICVVAIAGPSRTGKSYLLSQLISHLTTEQFCFKVGNSMDALTKGIWMWDTPVKYTLKDGNQVSLIFLDTEGIGDHSTSDHSDNQIFTLTTLLSSLLIFNTKNVPKRGDLQNLQYPFILMFVIVP